MKNSKIFEFEFSEALNSVAARSFNFHLLCQYYSIMPLDIRLEPAKCLFSVYDVWARYTFGESEVFLQQHLEYSDNDCASFLLLWIHVARKSIDQVCVAIKLTF